MPRTNFLL